MSDQIPVEPPVQTVQAPDESVVTPVASVVAATPAPTETVVQDATPVLSPPVQTPATTGSPAWHLSKADWEKWALETLYFSAPVFTVFFGALANGVAFHTAFVLMYIAGFQAFQNLFKKLADNSQSTTL